MENEPLHTENENTENNDTVTKDRSLLYMGLVLGIVIAVMGYLTLFVEDPSKLFKKKGGTELTAEEHESILNESETMSEEEVRSTLTKFIEAFYYDQRRGYFDPPSYFAPITETFYNYHHLTYNRLKELYWKRKMDMQNFSRNWIVSTLEFERADSRITATYWARESYLRRSLNENYSALIKYEMIIDESGKIVSLKEVEVKDVQTEKVQPDTTVVMPDVSMLEEAAANTGSDKIYDYTLVDQVPEFPGGEKELARFIASSIKYPAAARQNKVQGKVYLSFVVEKDGQITDVKVKQGIGSGCDEEAVRVLRSSPKWKPGLIKESPVRTYFILPVTFQL